MGILVRPRSEGGGYGGWRREVDDIVLSADGAEYTVHETDEAVCVLDGWLCSGGGATELLALYRERGMSAVAAQDGQYVAVVHDRSRGETHLVADPGGFGNACYRASGFGYGSRPYDLGTATLSSEGLALYLTFQYVPVPYSIFEGVRRVPPGAVVTRRATGCQVRQQTSFPSPADPSTEGAAAPEELAARVLDLLTESLARHAAPHERLGMMLSGGIDTSTNATVLATRLGCRPRAFTASFREAGYDESEYAALVAERFGFEHVVVPVGPETVERLPDLVRGFDSPNADQAIVATQVIAERAAQLSCTHIVTGEGGDEVMGFPMSPNDDIHLVDLPQNSRELARFYLGQIALGSAEDRALVHRTLGVPEELAVDILRELYEEHRAHSALDRLLFGQWRTWLTEGVYRKDHHVFRAAGPTGVLPFADPRVMRFVAEMPAGQRYRALDGKAMLRAGIAPHLPDRILKRKKHKFWIPFAEWFRGPLRDHLHDSLLSSPVATDLLDPKLVRTLVDSHERGIADKSGILWALCFLDAWLSALPRRPHGAP
ncbi:Asparagine synthetase B (glutamine-hydrolyzing) [Nocardia amikacinitolerans]|uniref:asparagine synthetase B family protein n=1 Tax=Nocardia amikacinitolerans TaxID=756689 RepID=UPI000832BDDF|nr:asparagine synthase C-terminal domain-containing protein [Nocardia amikacinitolerans]MCP2315593.1 Asparagine synthetase B (glutamine-hydrolyzing) [Nocardia amikacinitolerans]